MSTMRMVLGALAAVSWQQFALAIILIVVIYHIVNHYRYGTSDIPGPFLASFTDLWRVVAIFHGNSHNVDLQLHQKYGPMVRIAPNLVSIADPQEIPTIYGISSKFYKSRFYDPFMAHDEEGLIPDTFILRDRAMHSRMKKNGNAAYAMSSIVKMEEFADRETEKLFQAWDELYANNHQPFDVGRWMIFYALDAIFTLTYGEDFGFLDKREDQLWMIDTLEKISDYGAVIGQLPSLHRYIDGNAFLQNWALGPHFMESISGMLTLAKSQTQKLKNKLEVGEINPNQSATFVEKLLTTQKLNPKSLTDRELDTHAFGNITAGGDTTSIALRAILYYVLKDQRVKKRLMEEINSRNLSFPITYETASTMPYLQAIIRESMRLHPSVGLLLARTVPVGGATICGRFFREGVDIGINPYIVHRDEKLFPDPSKFKPERWLTSDATHLAAMNRAYLTFGHGPHTCSGKHISLMEISKLVPALFDRYEMELVDEGRDVKIKNHWFMFQTGIVIRISRRSNGLKEG